ncbi:MAG: hypothetical protein ACXVCP_17370 [Bdellovibrio sp.]
MRSFLAILIFLVAASLIIYSQAQAQISPEVPPPPPSCGSCGRANSYVKYCGTLRGDLIYSFNEIENEKNKGPGKRFPFKKSEVELCLDLADGGYNCGVSSDSLLITSLNTMLGLGVKQFCMKVDASTEPRQIVLIQGRQK